MSPLSIGLLAVGMSVDAFVAALGNGASQKHPGFGRALKTGVIFGLVEALTPLLGWAAGILASGYVQAIDHWIAFILLLLVGGRMALHGWRDRNAPLAMQRNARRRGIAVLLVTALGTSIDAMAVGVSLAFLNENILAIALAIGAATATMATLGVMAGHAIGARLGHIAEMAGGLLLVALGSGILLEHMTH